MDSEIPYGWLSHPILEEHIAEFGLAGIEKNHLMNSPGPYQLYLSGKSAE